MRDELPKLLHVDFDLTITEGGDYDPFNPEEIADAEPDDEMRNLLRSLTEEGHIIVVWTARPWGQAPEVAGWLTRHSVPHEGLKMNKGGGGAYIDDRSITPEQFKQTHG